MFRSPWRSDWSGVLARCDTNGRGQEMVARNRRTCARNTAKLGAPPAIHQGCRQSNMVDTMASMTAARLRPRARLTVISVTSILLIPLASSCSNNTEHGAAEELAAWMVAIEDRDVKACDMELGSLNSELLEAIDADPSISCEERVAQFGSILGLGSDSSATSLVWDPSGEALVEVATEPDPVQFFMVYKEGSWKVAEKV